MEVNSSYFWQSWLKRTLGERGPFPASLMLWRNRNIAEVREPGLERFTTKGSFGIKIKVRSRDIRSNIQFSSHTFWFTVGAISVGAISNQLKTKQNLNCILQFKCLKAFLSFLAKKNNLHIFVLKDKLFPTNYNLVIIWGGGEGGRVNWEARQYLPYYSMQLHKKKWYIYIYF